MLSWLKKSSKKRECCKIQFEEVKKEEKPSCCNVRIEEVNEEEENHIKHPSAACKAGKK